MFYSHFSCENATTLGKFDQAAHFYLIPSSIGKCVEDFLHNIQPKGMWEKEKSPDEMASFLNEISFIRWWWKGTSRKAESS